MAWLAEILRKEHRQCSVCGMAPTHRYGARAGSPDEEPAEEDDVTATHLCNACLPDRLAADIAALDGMLLVFEPCLGPDSLLFRQVAALGNGGNSEALARSVRSALDPARATSCPCGDQARAVWVPAGEDAALWGDEWVEALAARELVPERALCAGCVARKVASSLEIRGLYCEWIEKPEGGDGLLMPGS